MPPDITGQDSINLISPKDALTSFTTLFDKVSTVVEERGIRSVAVSSGISLLFIVLAKHFISFFKGSTTTDYIDLTLIICGIIITISGLLVSSYEFRFYNQCKLKERELLLEKYKIELEYNLKRLEVTDTSLSDTSKELNAPKEEIQKLPK